MSEWKNCILGEFVESISTTYKFQPNEEVIFLNTSDIFLGNVLNKNPENSAKLPGQAKKRIQKGDFLFSEIRPANGRYAFINFDAEKYVVSTKLMVLRCNSNINVDFFRLFLTSKENLDYLQMLAEDRSGTFPQITFDHISSLEISLPPLPEQTAIASILSSLDDKIDLLHRQNATLEKMAETLFRQWFVEEAKEENKMGKISDYAFHFKKSIQPQKHQSIIFHHYSIPSFDNGKEPLIEVGNEIQSNKYQVKENCILFSKLNPHKDKRVWLIQNENKSNSICSTEFQVILPKKKEYLYFLYGWLTLFENYNEIASGIGGTSGSHQRIDPNTIFNFQCPIFEDSFFNKINIQIEPIFKKQLSNQSQIRTLTALRDTLLPKLMSGEVRVEY